MYVDKLNTRLRKQAEERKWQLEEHVNSLNAKLKSYDWETLSYRCMLSVLTEEGFEYQKGDKLDSVLVVRKKDKKALKLPIPPWWNKGKKKTKKSKSLLAVLTFIVTVLLGLIVLANELNLLPVSLGLAVDVVHAFSSGAFILGAFLALILIVVVTVSGEGEGVDPSGFVFASKLVFKATSFALHKVDTMDIDIASADRQFAEEEKRIHEQFEQIKAYYSQKYLEVIEKNKEKFLEEHRKSLNSVIQ